jgi:hypothetical protein
MFLSSLVETRAADLLGLFGEPLNARSVPNEARITFQENASVLLCRVEFLSRCS